MQFNVSENTFACQFFFDRACLNSRSIQKFLQQQLFLALSRTELGTTIDLSPAVIPFSRLNYPVGRVYRSAIAFQLSQVLDRSPLEIAIELGRNLSVLQTENPTSSYLDFTIGAVEPGWLDFPLSDRALGTWLQQLPHCFWTESRVNRSFRQQELPKIDPFPIQFAHARCCSLLRLGHREELIVLAEPEFAYPSWHWQHPDPIPWTDDDLPYRPFQLVRPPETYAIGQILALTDALDRPQVINWISRGMDLAKAILEVNRHCRIFGEVRRETVKLAQARLGLIAIARLLLQVLLQERIGVSAPTEL